MGETLGWISSACYLASPCPPARRPCLRRRGLASPIRSFHTTALPSSCSSQGSRLSQITRNINRRSAEGLAAGMFCLAVAGNLSYGASETSLYSFDLLPLAIITHSRAAPERGSFCSRTPPRHTLCMSIRRRERAAARAHGPGALRFIPVGPRLARHCHARFVHRWPGHRIWVEKSWAGECQRRRGAGRTSGRIWRRDAGLGGVARVAACRRRHGGDSCVRQRAGAEGRHGAGGGRGAGTRGGVVGRLCVGRRWSLWRRRAAGGGRKGGERHFGAGWWRSNSGRHCSSRRRGSSGGSRRGLTLRVRYIALGLG